MRLIDFGRLGRRQVFRPPKSQAFTGPVGQGRRYPATRMTRSRKWLPSIITTGRSSTWIGVDSHSCSCAWLSATQRRETELFDAGSGTSTSRGNCYASCAGCRVVDTFSIPCNLCAYQISAGKRHFQCLLIKASVATCRRECRERRRRQASRMGAGDGAVAWTTRAWNGPSVLSAGWRNAGRADVVHDPRPRAGLGGSPQAHRLRSEPSVGACNTQCLHFTLPDAGIVRRRSSIRVRKPPGAESCHARAWAAARLVCWPVAAAEPSFRGFGAVGAVGTAARSQPTQWSR